MSATTTAPASSQWVHAVGDRADDMIGEVVAWTVHGETALPAVRAALTAAGLDENVAPNFLPRNAFARACDRMESERIIRKLLETEEELVFQFTAEKRTDTDGDAQFSYERETKLTLKKKSGEIACEHEALADLARKRLAHALAVRTANDVTNMVQRLFERRSKRHLDADLFPIREAGGVYLVLATQAGFLDQIGKFLADCGGRMNRFPIPAGTTTGDGSVQEVVGRKMRGLVVQHEAAVAALDDADPSQIDKVAERVQVTREKLEIYRAYLGTQQESLGEQLARVEADLRERLTRMVAATTEPTEPVPVDAISDASSGDVSEAPAVAPAVATAVAPAA